MEIYIEGMGMDKSILMRTDFWSSISNNDLMKY